MLIDLPTAKLQASIDADADDALITIYIGAAERFAAEYLQRNIYADQEALTTAVEDIPAALATATTAYNAAIAAAELMDAGIGRNMAVFAANDAYSHAQQVARMVHQGIVLNDTIKAAMLLIVGHLYQNREDTVIGVSVAELPMGSRYLLDLLRAY